MINSIEDNEWIFNIIEEKISNFLSELGPKLIRVALESLDVYILEDRNKSIYRCKGKREKTINTSIGSVSYKRRLYEEKISRNEVRTVFLLDEILKLKFLGKSTLKQAINLVTEALAESFRNVSEQNNSPLLCNPSHQTVKNRISDIANLFKNAETERIQKYYENELHGEKQVEILFEEKDGLFLSIQGQKSKKEIKLAKVYEGWQLERESSKRYKTINPLYFAGYENPEQFDAIVNSGIAEVYDSDYLKTKILNGDGAEWISKEVEMDATVQYQLDLFHIYEKATRKITNSDDRNRIKKLIKNKEFEKLIDECKKLYENELDEKEKEKLREVYIYYQNHKDFLKRYIDRDDFKLDVKQELRDLGTMESSIHNVLATRMKGHGLSWSVTGADAMAKLLCLKHSKQDLGEAIQDIANRHIDKNLKYDVKCELDNQLIKAKKDVNNAVRELIYEKPRKFSNKESHIQVFNNKLTQLFKALHGLLEN